MRAESPQGGSQVALVLEDRGRERSIEAIAAKRTRRLLTAPFARPLFCVSKPAR